MGRGALHASDIVGYLTLMESRVSRMGCISRAWYISLSRGGRYNRARAGRLLTWLVGCNCGALPPSLPGRRDSPAINETMTIKRPLYSHFRDVLPTLSGSGY